MLAGTDDHLTWLSPVILNLESTGLTHIESEKRVNLRVDGVHEDEGETCEVTEAKVKQVLKEKLSLPNDPMIERARRIGKKLSSTAPRRLRIVVCRLRDCKERESLSKLARRIEPERIYIKEDLAQATIEKPEEQRAKFEEAERAGKIVYLY